MTDSPPQLIDINLRGRYAGVTALLLVLVGIAGVVAMGTVITISNEVRFARIILLQIALVATLAVAAKRTSAARLSYQTSCWPTDPPLRHSFVPAWDGKDSPPFLEDTGKSGGILPARLAAKMAALRGNASRSSLVYVPIRFLTVLTGSE